MKTAWSNFNELDSTIAGGATDVLQSGGRAKMDVANVLDVDGWVGRLSCDVLSAGDTSVQVLVRSDGSLLNNTYVDD